jgi:hypothetical protein
MKLVITPILTTTPVVSVPQPTNRILVIDCSWSMSNDLPKLRTMLKNKLPTMIQPQDTLSIIWFAGRGQSGILFEATKLETLTDIQRVSAAIDRFIIPIGMTGFKAPLENVQDLAKRLSGDCTLSFLTDGGENVSTRAEILSICNALQEELASVTMVEFGYYADSKMILDMAEEVGGSVVLAENFLNYEESLVSNLNSSVSGKKIKLTKITAPFVIGNLPDTFVIARPDAIGTVTLPANSVSYSFFEGLGDIESVTDYGIVDTNHAAYAVSALILRGEADKAMQLAGVIGDVILYNQVENSFSKQDFARTVELANKIGSGKTQLYATTPRKKNLVPDENSYNILTMLMDLADTEGNYLDLSHPEFVYNSGGAKRETVAGDDSFVPVFSDKSSEIKAEIKSLKFDEDRPNINILVKREGNVTLPPNELGFDKTFETYIWRNYSIVRDGIVNVPKLPVVLSKATFDLFTQLGVITEEFKVGKTFVIDTKKWPIINRSMVKSVTAKSLFDMNFDLYVLQVKQKVLASKLEKSEVGLKFSAKFGDDGAKFLKQLGISEGGFSPKTSADVNVDTYTAKVLEVKMSGLNAIPKVADVEKAIADGKNLTPAFKVMSDVIDSISGLVTTNEYSAELKKTKFALKDLLNQIVMVKFGIIIGKKWFSDITMENPTLQLEYNLGKVVVGTMSLTDKEV